MNNEHKERIEGHPIVGGDDSRRIPGDRSRAIQARGDLSDIRSYTAGLSDEHGGDREAGERKLREKESERLIDIAKQVGQFIPTERYGDFGDKVSKKSGESIVYKRGDVYTKVKDPYAKQPIKGTHAEDAIYEHVIHNLLFPNVRYTFLGISEDLWDVRIVLEQKAITSFRRPTERQIVDYLENVMGLEKEDVYTWGNGTYAITDESENSDNVLLGVDGQLYFIDPIIKLRKPAKEVIESLMR